MELCRVVCRWDARMWWYNRSRSDRTQSTATVIPGAPFSVVFTWLAMFLPASLGPKANTNQCCVLTTCPSEIASEIIRISFACQSFMRRSRSRIKFVQFELLHFIGGPPHLIWYVSKWAFGVTTHTETYLRQTRRLIAKQWLQIANKQQQQSVNSL